MLIEVFKAGKHTDSQGNTETYTTEMLDRLVYNYAQQLADNPNNLAPLVKGHPQADEPACGWVKKLFRRGKKLIAQIDKVDSNLIDDLKSDKYKGFSIALYPNMQLRHIGVLGAVAPAVKGLNPDGVMYFQAETNSKNIKIAADNELKNYLNTTKELALVHETDANKSIPEQSDSIPEQDKNHSTDTVDKDDLINKLQAANVQLLGQLQALQQKNRKYEFNDYANAIAADCHLADTPAAKVALVDILELAYNSDARPAEIVSQQTTKEFNAAQAPGAVASRSKIEPPIVRKLKSLLKQMEQAEPPQGDTFQSAELLTDLTFNERQNYRTVSSDFDNPQVNPKRHKLHVAAMQYCRQNPDATYQDAIEHALLVNNY